eukprot:tig00000741_g3847.t1
MAVAERALLQGGKVLFIVQTNTLSDQQGGRMVERLRPWRIGTNTAGTRIHWGRELREKDGFVCTAGLLLSALEAPGEDADRPALHHFALLVIDECHHVKKQHPFHRILREHYHPLRRAGRPVPSILGLTATPVVGDLSLERTINELRRLMRRMRSSDRMRARIQSVHDDFKEELGAAVSRARMEKVVVRLGPEERAFQEACRRLIDAAERLLPASEEPPAGDVPRATEEYSKRARERAQELTEAARARGGGGELALGPEAGVVEAACLWRWLEVASDAWRLMFDFGLEEGRRHLAGSARAMRHVFAAGATVRGPPAAMQTLLAAAEASLAGYGTALAPLAAEGSDAGSWADFLPRPREESVRSVEKFKRLEQILAEHAAEAAAPSGGAEAAAGPGFRAIVFVEERSAAGALQRALNATGAQRPVPIRAERLVGQGEGGMTIAQQKGAVQRFRDGTVNVLVATSIAEEGLDIPSCQLVVRYDGATSWRQLVQSRGRARNAASTFVCMFHEGSPAEVAFGQTELREAVMQRAVETLQSEPRDEPQGGGAGDDASSGGSDGEDDEAAPPYARIESRDEFLRQYSSRLVSHVRAELGVEIETEAEASGPPHKPVFVATARLSGPAAGLPAALPRAFRGGPEETKRGAVRGAEAAALAALDDAGLLTLPPDFREARWRPRAASRSGPPVGPGPEEARGAWLAQYAWSSLLASLRMAAGAPHVAAEPPGLPRSAWQPAEQYSPSGPPFAARLRFPFPAPGGEGAEFEGRGPSKDAARAAAAKAACEWLDARGALWPSPSSGPNGPPTAGTRFFFRGRWCRRVAGAASAAGAAAGGAEAGAGAARQLLEQYGMPCLRASLQGLRAEREGPRYGIPPAVPAPLSLKVRLALPAAAAGAGAELLEFVREGPKRERAEKAAAGAACEELWRRGCLRLDPSIPRSAARDLLAGPFRPGAL